MAHFGNFDGYHVGDHNNTKPGRENAHPRQPREAEKTGKCSKDKDTFRGLLDLHSRICRSLSLFLGLIRLFNLTSGVSNITQQAVLVECAKVALPFCFPPSNIFQHLPTHFNCRPRFLFAEIVLPSRPSRPSGCGYGRSQGVQLLRNGGHYSFTGMVPWHYPDSRPFALVGHILEML